MATPSASKSAASAPSSFVPVSEGLTPLDYSFVSDTDGWLLAREPCADPLTCDGVIFRTYDAGANWSRIGSSPFPTWYPCAKPCGVRAFAGSIRFADPLHGFLFGQYLAIPDGGGHTWRDGHVRVSYLESDQHDAIAVAPNCDTDVAECVPVLTRAPIGGAFKTLDAPAFAYGNLGYLARQGANVWLLLGGSKRNVLLRSVDDGAHWQTLTVPCETPLGEAPRPAQAAYLKSTGKTTLWTSCEENNGVLISQDAGATWTASAALNPSSGVHIEDVAPASVTMGYIATTDQRLLITHDAGHTWTTSFRGHDRFGIIDKIGVEDTEHAHFLLSRSIWSTSDGGAHWTQYAFS